jgi:hypothetical protein
MAPDYKNFLKFINTNDLTSKMTSFDFDSVSEYALEKLEPYIKNPNFVPDYVKQISFISSVLCKWCIFVYEICSIKTTVYLTCLNIKLMHLLNK